VSYQPPAAAIDPQVCHRRSLRRINVTTTDIKPVLAGGQPVMLGIQMSLPLLQTTDGFIAVPTPAEMLAEGHAMLVVGYDDGAAGQGHYIVRNSWGTGWGDAGYAYLPYDYLVRYGGEAWLIA
jgi:hypothetical protein